MITFYTNDGSNFVLNNDLGLQSKFLTSLLESDSEIVLPLDISKGGCAKMVEYLEKHKDHPLEPLPRPLGAESLNDLVPVWDALWVEQLSWQHLQEIVQVANYLDMGSLLDITCARIALFLRDKSVEQIRTFFNVKENFTPDEIAAIQDEQKYLRMEQRLAEKQ